MTATEGMELLMMEPKKMSPAQRYLAKRLDRRFKDRKPPFTQDALDKLIAEVLAHCDISDLLQADRAELRSQLPNGNERRKLLPQRKLTPE